MSDEWPTIREAKAALVEKARKDEETRQRLRLEAVKREEDLGKLAELKFVQCIEWVKNDMREGRTRCVCNLSRELAAQSAGYENFSYRNVRSAYSYTTQFDWKLPT